MRRSVAFFTLQRRRFWTANEKKDIFGWSQSPSRNDFKVRGGSGDENGGYAALVLLGKQDMIDNKRLLRWVASRQMRLEGGFQGRTNKLVDGCYSFWQGGVFLCFILSLMLSLSDEK